jgi:hypothetical protein
MEIENSACECERKNLSTVSDAIIMLKLVTQKFLTKNYQCFEDGCNMLFPPNIKKRALL